LVAGRITAQVRPSPRCRNRHLPYSRRRLRDSLRLPRREWTRPRLPSEPALHSLRRTVRRLVPDRSSATLDTASPTCSDTHQRDRKCRPGLSSTTVRSSSTQSRWNCIGIHVLRNQSRRLARRRSRLSSSSICRRSSLRGPPSPSSRSSPNANPLCPSTVLHPVRMPRQSSRSFTWKPTLFPLRQIGRGGALTSSWR